MTLARYTREPSASGWRYRLAGTLLGFSVVPFEGLWRATNGARSAWGMTPEYAAQRYIEEI